MSSIVLASTRIISMDAAHPGPVRLVWIYFSIMTGGLFIIPHIVFP